MASDVQSDMDAIAAISSVPTILDVVCSVTGMGFAAVARVTHDRWIACNVKDDIGFGLTPGGELKVETTICHEVRESREPVVINHVAEDARFRGHATPAMYGFQSYISMPIVLPDGRFFGTLCAIDPRPALLKTPAIIGMFKLFAELIAQHLDASQRLSFSQTALMDERRTAELREMFIAVLGHDLRNPLAAISSGIAIVGRTPLNDRARRVVLMMQQSVVRMAELISNVTDFARGRLGGGIGLQRQATVDLGSVLDQVIGEMRMVWPDRVIAERVDLAGPVDCDPDRIGQLFSNLLSNALAYGLPDEPVHVAAQAVAGRFTLSVSNAGPVISAERLERLFEPFQRGTHDRHRQGLGLGLHIAAEIARAHGGALIATSSPDATCFTLQIPAL